MARFDKYLGEAKGRESKKKKIKVEKEKFIAKPLSEWMEEASLFFKYSELFGKYFFYLSPIKNFTIRITRKMFKNLPNYPEDLEEEGKIAAGIFGMFYLMLLLSLLVLSSESLSPTLLLLTIGIVATISNINIARKYITLGKVGAVPISSNEVLSFLSWLILLIESGMNLFGALDYYVSKENNNLSMLLDNALKQVRTGELSIDKALSNLSIEIQRNDLREILTLILQSKHQGVSIKDTLYSYFEHYQADIQSLAEKKGSSANQKATFILTTEVFLLMIIFMLAMLGSLSMF